MLFKFCSISHHGLPGSILFFWARQLNKKEAAVALAPFELEYLLSFSRSPNTNLIFIYSTLVGVGQMLPA